MSKRFETIDIVKGITILLVVAGHAGVPSEINDFFRNFRMPLFFLVTGFLFSAYKFENVSNLINNRFWTLIVPYVTAGIFTFFFLFSLSFLGRDKPLLTEHIKGIAIGNGEYLSNIPLWFLTCLFSTQIIFYIFMKSIQSTTVFFQWIIVFTLGTIGVFLGEIQHLPWGIDVALVAQPFLFMGYKLKDLKVLEKNWKIFSLSFISIFLIFLISVNLNSLIDMNNRVYGNIILFYIGGFTGSILVIKFCELMISFRSTVRFLTYIGKESLVILTFHMQFSFTVVVILYDLIFGEFPAWYTIFTLGVTICILVSVITGKFPYLNIIIKGKKPDLKRLSSSMLSFKQNVN
ncbi:acyltransferase family protein [Halalkalibacter akibai]|uniref:Acyltransferase 3 domain-containing protein n=1 Tax=Halalkalibacter akibai (strain ATCC 43226 / DSM 21942 / CIP 109018 / JCM 9157 / 1139) TaxID=1236973 RepID=W4QUY0_HALA3|nr:acyltransferase family protein [Halalkalibacter akibai]GAE35935.1 hypothetical protein JCM9157_3076 [Halalkalibacter akibai JCM 9157]